MGLFKTREEIEKLTKEINKLESQLFLAQNIKPSIINYNDNNIYPLRVKTVIKPEMPVEYAKEQVLRDMLKYLKDFVEYDIDNNEQGLIEISGTLLVGKRD